MTRTIPQVNPLIKAILEELIAYEDYFFVYYMGKDELDVELVPLEVEFDIVFDELLVELEVLLEVEFNGILELLLNEEEFEVEFEVLLFKVEFVNEEFDVPF